MLPTLSNQDLLNTALTHRSALAKEGQESNERLEFLGDAVLELATSSYLYHVSPTANEGLLTSFRAALVRTTTLAKVAKTLGLGELLHLSKGEEQSGGRDNVGLLADTFEAFTGALYEDQGYAACYAFLSEHLFSLFETILKDGTYRDHKTALQEFVQAQGKRTPTYTTIDEKGPDHDKVFTVEVVIDGKPMGTGSGKSKQEAQQDGARVVLEKLGVS